MDKAQLKTHGLAFGRSVQTAFKTVVMYSVNHPASERFIQQAFTTLSSLLAQLPQFTFGFANQRLLLNGLLTDEPALSQLAADFQRRGVAGVTFQAGISVSEFKQALTVLAAKPKDIDAAGGMAEFLTTHPLGKARIVVVKDQYGGDSVLEGDTESYLKGEAPPAPEALSSQSLSALLDFAGMEMRQPSGAPLRGHEILDVVGKATEAALLGQTPDPQAVVGALAQLVNEVGPATVLSALPVGKQAGLQDQPAADIAADMVEDVAANLAANRIATAPEGPLSASAEQEAIHIMTVGLGMTRMADRLLQKLEHTLREANMPPEVFERIQQGILWHGLSEAEKHGQLLRTERYGDREFQRLLEYVKECMQAKKVAEALEVAGNYFRFLDGPPAAVQAELPRSRELLRMLADPSTLQFLGDIANRLGTRLLDEQDASPECHSLLVDALVTLARLAVEQGDFALIHRAGQVLERSGARVGGQHAGCCGAALASLVPGEIAPRLADLYLEKRGDAEQAKLIVDLLRWMGTAGAEEAFRRLTEEQASSERMLLLGLLTQMRPAGIEAARRHLGDERWYVVRNACVVLGDLEDPDIVQDVRGALRHADGRVQQAAVTALVKSEAAGVTEALAEALPALDARIAETALEELSFQKDPATIDGLEKFLHLCKGTKPAALEKAVRALAMIPAERAARVLGVVMGDAGQVPFVRRAAAEALTQSAQPVARRLLAAYVRVAPTDPVATLVQRSLQRAPQA